MVEIFKVVPENTSKINNPTTRVEDEFPCMKTKPNSVFVFAYYLSLNSKTKKKTQLNYSEAINQIFMLKDAPLP